ncbi:MAG: hypothetical protein HY553_03630 [Elusimicrobia bacterium]|nr:hypothetical protein [Elusimicrobiota bacterium]
MLEMVPKELSSADFDPSDPDALERVVREALRGRKLAPLRGAMSRLRVQDPDAYEDLLAEAKTRVLEARRAYDPARARTTPRKNAKNVAEYAVKKALEARSMTISASAFAASADADGEQESDSPVDVLDGWRTPSVFDLEDDPDATASAAARATEKSLLEKRLLQIDAADAELSDAERATLETLELPVADVAARLSVSEGVVKVRRHRLRKKLAAFREADPLTHPRGPEGPPALEAAPVEIRGLPRTFDPL